MMFRFFVNTTYVLAMLVIIAGGVVRMSGSGMGCPDWPKCFGHYIPPTDVSELQWGEKDFVKGQMILHEEKLYKAKSSFKPSGSIDMNNWELFEDHSYTTYNVAHTYTEYINRLVGALLGFSALLMVIGSLRTENKGKSFFAAFIVLILIGFEGWLGAVVVESVLTPFKVTIHMLGAFVIIAMLLWIRSWEREVVVLPAGRGRGWLGLLSHCYWFRLFLGRKYASRLMSS